MEFFNFDPTARSAGRRGGGVGGVRADRRVTVRQFTDGNATSWRARPKVDTAQALLDRRRRARKRKRGNFAKLMAGWNTLDVEVVNRQAVALGRRRRGPGRRAAGAGRRPGGRVRSQLFAFGCRLCAAEVIVAGGRRRRFCDDCSRRLAIRMRRMRQGRRFVRGLDGVQEQR
jgi:hypothetical protein